MKKILFITIFMFFLGSLKAQYEFIIETGLNHVAHQMPTPLFESSHWVPGSLTFWNDDNYDSGSELFTNYLSIYDTDFLTFMDKDEFRIDQYGLFALQFDFRIKLDRDGLNMRNAAGFTGLHLNSSNGSIQARQSGGIQSFMIESIASNAPIFNTVSIMGLLDPTDPDVYPSYMAVIQDIFNPGTFFGLVNTDQVVSKFIYSDTLSANMVSASIKNFSMPHPEKPGKEIWYACIEGPEAAAYERGTARLINGEAFIKFSDHYRVVANANTMTVQLTPLEWDTYGLAIVEKTAEGFRVKELKGGSGNFDFDWEVKSIRKGYEDYVVERDTRPDRLKYLDPADRKTIEKAQTKEPKLDTRRDRSTQIHHPSCVFHDKK